MLNAKLNLNGIDIQLEGDKDDILYALSHTSLSSIPDRRVSLSSANIKAEISTKSPKPTIKPVEKSARFTKEQLIKIYQHLQNKGNYQINQFSIVRGGKDNPQTYTVCLVFDTNQQRYIHYNPCGQDVFKKTFTVQEAIDALNNNAEGFSLLHIVAENINKNVEAISAFKRITSNLDATHKEIETNDFEFKNYDKTVKERLNSTTGKPRYKSFIAKNVKVGDKFNSDSINRAIRKKSEITKNVANRILGLLVKDGIIKSVHNPGTKRSKTWERIV
jgi:hypothetical protein